MKTLAVLSLSLAAVTSLPAAILASEDFTYPDGNLVGNGGWTTHSGVGEFIQVVSGAAVLNHGSGSREDAGLNFPSLSSGVITAQFDLSVTDDSIIGTGGTDFEYFAHFMSDGGFNFRARLDIVAPSGVGDYTLGLASGSSTAEVTYGTDLTFGTTYDILLAFDFASGTAALTVDGGATINSSAQFLGESFDRFALRQSTSSANESITVDNIVIVPEPSTTLLGALGLLALYRRKR